MQGGADYHIHTDLVDIVGHLDAIKWLFPEERQRIQSEAKELLQVIARWGKSVKIEFNHAPF